MNKTGCCLRGRIPCITRPHECDRLANLAESHRRVPVPRALSELHEPSAVAFDASDSDKVHVVCSPRYLSGVHKQRESQYDHPVEWAEPDIAAILGRLLLQQETGILGQHRSLEPVWSSDEVAQLTPALHTAFRQAQTREWVSFAFLQPSGTNLVVTSGGFFFKDRQMHVVLANYREIIHEYAVDIELVQ